MGTSLYHYGTPRHSGRYPWGSGENPYQSAVGWRAHIKDLEDQGMTEKQIADLEGISVNRLRARKSISKDEIRSNNRARAIKLKDKGYSTTEIGRMMKINESSVRSLLDPVIAERAAITKETINMLRDQVDKKRFIDIGVGTENHIKVNRNRFNRAVMELEEQGYKVHTVNVPQQGIPGQFTIMKALGAPDTTWKELVQDTSQIQAIDVISDNFGRSFKSNLGLGPIKSFDSKKLLVKYYEDGGKDKDGVIELRRGVKDLDMGESKYAQVRIAVDDTHFLKGMAIYKDDMPDGVDIIFNTNKHDTGNKLNALKKMKTDPNDPTKLDPDNPFGATIKQNGQRGVLNIVNEEGDWDSWSRTISSQILSKQPVSLAKTQLNLAHKDKQDEFDSIMAFTNPTIKKELLLKFADSCDSAAVHLKAAALPRQASKVILPLPSIKENEVYAPSFNNGEVVALIRHPHGGTFEIPELIVNNKHPQAQSIMKNAVDAIGIHHTVAEKLSGADFDGDAVIVIPNERGLIKTQPSLKKLENFDPIEMYKGYDGMKTIDGGIYDAKKNEVNYPPTKDGLPGKPKTQTKQTKMGEVSNLITDMTIKGANPSEIARAVRHSMVVIDSEKHALDYLRSYRENGIAALSAHYQNSARGGASTLISKASSEFRVDEKKLRPAKDGGPIDVETGEKVYVKTNRGYTTKAGKQVVFTTVTTRMAETKDAYTLSSGRPIEDVYASYANSMKTLGNTARLNAIRTVPTPYDPSAKRVYQKEVASLNLKLSNAYKNKPLERQAQIIANNVVDRKLEGNKGLDKDDIKKIRNQALTEARVKTGASKSQIYIEDNEWKAIQAGAITTTTLSNIIKNSDINRVKQLATPRSSVTLTNSKLSRAKSMLATGYTQAEVAEHLGISVSTLSKALNQ